ncbi:MAG TPA: hypothetical protein VF986_03240 [Actinomycetota bacterium]|nr:hypothetical protein [Actinomycetota bacterium]
MYELLVVYGSAVALIAVIIYVMILAERGRRQRHEEHNQSQGQRPEHRRAA